MRRTTVLNVIPSLNGGTGKDLVQKAVAMDGDDFEVTIFAFDEPGTFSHYANGKDHVSVVSPGDDTLLSAVRSGQRLLSSLNPDIVHAYLFKGYLIGSALTVGRDQPLVYSVQNLEDNKSPLKRTVHRTIDWTVDRLIAISTAVSEDYQTKANISPGRIEVIPNSAAFERLAVDDPPRRATPVVGTVARLHPVKRLDTLLRAVAKVSETHPDVTCQIIGEDQGEGDSLRTLTEDLGIADRVTFEGWISDPYEQLAVMDVFVLPSQTEGMGMVAVEALGLGVPTVVSDIGGLRDVVRDGETGWRVPVGDVDSFADRIGWCLSNSSRAREMARAGQTDVRDRFGADTLARRQQKLYTELTTIRTI